jgi:hypothetical protein
MDTKRGLAGWARGAASTATRTPARRAEKEIERCIIPETRECISSGTRFNQMKEEKMGNEREKKGRP